MHRFLTAILFLSLFGHVDLDAQEVYGVHNGAGRIDSVGSDHLKSTRPEQKDIVDLLISLEKPHHPRYDTISKIPGALHFSVVPAVGYTLSSGWAAILAANVGFYTNNPERTNISSVTTSIVYSQFEQITIPLEANIWTKDNHWNFVTDLRYYEYPQDTYGLGGHSKLQNADLIDYNHIRVHQSVLRKITRNIYGGLGYFLDYHWNVTESGNADSIVSDARAYGLNRKSVSSGAVVNVLYDNRKNSINPLSGFYTNILYRPNMTLLGSDNNWQALTIDVRKYFRIGAGDHSTLAFWNLDWLTVSGKPPYLDLPSTGWDAYNNTGRGYIQGRFRGKNMLYLESEYRFGITANGLIGAVIFANAQSFSEFPSNRFEVIWPGAGGGIRIKVNKHSNTNLAIDYGFGADGSHGLFVNLGEVF